MLTCDGRLEHEDASQEAAVKAIDTVPMLITQVQQCAKLYTAASSTLQNIACIRL